MSEVTETISKRSLKMSVGKVVGGDNLRELEAFVEDKHFPFWGKQQSNDFKKVNLYLCIYKFAKDVGYFKLWKMVEAWYHDSHKSVNHNVIQILVKLKAWGRQEIILGELENWKSAAKNVRIPKTLPPVHLCMDSVDFALPGKSLKLTGSENWSWKCKSIGSRYQVAFDALGRAVKIWGGYSPKLMDHVWVESHKEELSEKFNGATIIADSHYYSTRHKVEGIKFLAPKPGSVKEEGSKKKRKVYLTKKEIAENKRIRKLRARVEQPFAYVKNKFLALKGTFREKAEYLDCLVIFAFAIHNKSI